MGKKKTNAVPTDDDEFAEKIARAVAAAVKPAVADAVKPIANAVKPIKNMLKRLDALEEEEVEEPDAEEKSEPVVTLPRRGRSKSARSPSQAPPKPTSAAERKREASKQRREAERAEEDRLNAEREEDIRKVAAAEAAAADAAEAERRRVAAAAALQGTGAGAVLDDDELQRRLKAAGEELIGATAYALNEGCLAFYDKHKGCPNPFRAAPDARPWPCHFVPEDRFLVDTNRLMSTHQREEYTYLFPVAHYGHQMLLQAMDTAIAVPSKANVRHAQELHLLHNLVATRIRGLQVNTHLGSAVAGAAARVCADTTYERDIDDPALLAVVKTFKEKQNKLLLAKAAGTRKSDRIRDRRGTPYPGDRQRPPPAATADGASTSGGGGAAPRARSASPGHSGGSSRYASPAGSDRSRGR